MPTGPSKRAKLALLAAACLCSFAAGYVASRSIPGSGGPGASSTNSGARSQPTDQAEARQPPGTSREPAKERAQAEARDTAETKKAIALLASGRPADWRHGQRCLARIGVAAVPELLRASSSTHPGTREGARNVLRLFSGPEHAEALVKCAQDPELADAADTWLRALETDAEMAPIIAAASDPSKSYRRRTPLMNVLADSPAPKARDALKVLASDKVPQVRRRALALLSHVPGAATTELLVKAVKDPSDQVAHEAIDALGRRKEQAAVPVLCEVAAGPKADARALLAVGALGRIGDRSTALLLLRLLDTPDSAFRMRWDAKAFRRAVGRALRQLTGQDFGQDAAAWRQWLRQQDSKTGQAGGEAAQRPPARPGSSEPAGGSGHTPPVPE